MKKILITTLVACALVSSALAQGVISLSATGSSTTGWEAGMIGYTLDGKAPYSLFPKGAPATLAPYGKINVALYSAVPGTQLSFVGGLPDLTGAWKKQTSAFISDLAENGYMITKKVNVDTSTLDISGNVQLTVVAWTGDFATLAESAAGGGLVAWTGGAGSLAGGSASWLQATGNNLLPKAITKGANAFNGLVLAPIPEPSTFALAGLGAAALLIFRRRK